MTDNEKQEIIEDVLTSIYNQSTEVTSLDKAASMTDMTGLPAVDKGGKLVSVPITLFNDLVSDACESISAEDLERILN